MSEVCLIATARGVTGRTPYDIDVTDKAVVATSGATRIEVARDSLSTRMTMPGLIGRAKRPGTTIADLFSECGKQSSSPTTAAILQGLADRIKARP